MNSKQYYETVDFVKEKPPSNGLYSARVKGYGFDQLWFSDGGWYKYGSNKLISDVEVWLRPVDLSELIREVAGKAFDAGMQREFDNQFGSVPTKAPDKETYINSLIK